MVPATRSPLSDAWLWKVAKAAKNAKATRGRRDGSGDDSSAARELCRQASLGFRISRSDGVRRSARNRCGKITQQATGSVPVACLGKRVEGACFAARRAGACGESREYGMRGHGIRGTGHEAAAQGRSIDCANPARKGDDLGRRVRTVQGAVTTTNVIQHKACIVLRVP